MRCWTSSSGSWTLWWPKLAATQVGGGRCNRLQQMGLQEPAAPSDAAFSALLAPPPDLECVLNIVSHLVARIAPPEGTAAAKRLAAALASRADDRAGARLQVWPPGGGSVEGCALHWRWRLGLQPAACREPRGRVARQL